ncbi:MAG TPA: HD domain-containing protein [Longimicrobiaceae bacterium]|nr:HD domain-containing protein [Longimicrobiaceae bacterium]
MILTQPIADALLFAARKHAGQHRKGASRAPYMRHLTDVAARLYGAGVRDEKLLQAALLHDTLEDTATTYDELAERFGADVADLVLEVTIPPEVKERGGWAGANYQLAQVPNASPRARVLKAADQLANVAELLADPPPAWDAERRAGYMAKATALLLRIVAGAYRTEPTMGLEFRGIIDEEPELERLRRHAGAGIEQHYLPGAHLYATTEPQA